MWFFTSKGRMQVVWSVYIYKLSTPKKTNTIYYKTFLLTDKLWTNSRKMDSSYISNKLRKYLFTVKFEFVWTVQCANNRETHMPGKKPRSTRLNHRHAVRFQSDVNEANFSGRILFMHSAPEPPTSINTKKGGPTARSNVLLHLPCNHKKFNIWQK